MMDFFNSLSGNNKRSGVQATMELSINALHKRSVLGRTDLFSANVSSALLGKFQATQCK